MVLSPKFTENEYKIFVNEEWNFVNSRSLFVIRFYLKKQLCQRKKEGCQFKGDFLRWSVENQKGVNAIDFVYSINTILALNGVAIHPPGSQLKTFLLQMVERDSSYRSESWTLVDGQISILVLLFRIIVRRISLHFSFLSPKGENKTIHKAGLPGAVHKDIPMSKTNYCKSGNIRGALIFANFTQNSAIQFKNPRKYLRYFVCTIWTHRSCVLTMCVDANG